MQSCRPSADLGGSSDDSVENEQRARPRVLSRAVCRPIHRRLKRSRFPCEQYLDMGESVLTPEESLLGKVSLSVVRGGCDSLTLSLNQH